MTDPRFPESPGALLDHIWNRLEAAVGQGSDPFHTPCLATEADSGPDARTVVLRRVEPARREICCHTDARSAKVGELRGRPGASWVFYDAQAGVQLRGRGTVTLHSSDSLAQEQWEATGPSSRRCYLSEGGPGAGLPAPGSGLPAALEERVPTAGESIPGRGNFVVIACRLEALDWLALDSRGHRRARFLWRDGAWDHAWITP